VRGLLIMMAALVSVVAGRAEQTTPAPATTGALRANAERRGWLDAARELYAAADYQKALDLLDQLVASNPSRQERESIDLCRILCLIALEKPREADEAMTSLFTRDPLYRPDPEMSPRLRAIFWTSAGSSCHRRFSCTTSAARRPSIDASTKSRPTRSARCSRRYRIQTLRSRRVGRRCRMFACSPPGSTTWRCEP